MTINDAHIKNDVQDMIIEYCDYVSHWVGGVAQPNDTYQDYLRDHYVKLIGRPLPPIPEGVTLPLAKVWVSSGRWIWQCPKCKTGLWADRCYPYTICVKCSSGGWHRQVWPRHRTQIERILLKRLGWRELAQDRTWKRGETIGMLEAENIILNTGDEGE
jgi:hypothetical protein